MASQSSSREKILHTASELFYHIGYQATSVDDILMECGVAKSNFYYHFKTKEQLAFEVLEARIAEFEALAAQSLGNRELAPKTRLERFLAEICGTQTGVYKLSGCPFGNFAAALPRDERYERFRLRLSRLFESMEEIVRGCLAEGIGRGEFRADIAVGEMATFLVGSVEGLLILAKTYQEAAPLKTGFAVLQKMLRLH